MFDRRQVLGWRIELTLLVGGFTGSADTAREAAQELGVAANALHVKAAA